jgi:hypothetical protein
MEKNTNKGNRKKSRLINRFRMYVKKYIMNFSKYKLRNITCVKNKIEIDSILFISTYNILDCHVVANIILWICGCEDKYLNGYTNG